MQYVRSGCITGYIYQTHCAPFPALNIKRRNEPVATRAIYSDTATIYSESDSAQIFVGLHTKYCDVYSMVNDKQIVETLWAVIRKRGAMDKLISNHVQLEVSKKLKTSCSSMH